MRKVFKTFIKVGLFFFTNICFLQALEWGDIEHFFKFTQSQSKLKNNISLLIKKQLKLKNGQNLWQSFLFWQNKMKNWQNQAKKEFSFEFTFVSTESYGAGIFPKAYDKEKQKFIFMIECNKDFFEKNFSEKEILETNMLYRPCLIRLDGQYHLREQKLPFFITLAHELLHALNQLERISEIFSINKSFFENLSLDENENLKSKLEKECPIQTFLKTKLDIQSSHLCLKPECTKLWGNADLDDSLDEMSVILGSERIIKDKESKEFISETSFLQEFYANSSIISWTHNNAHDIDLWKNNMPILIQENYVNKVLKCFFKNQKIELQEFDSHLYAFSIKNCISFVNTSSSFIVLEYLEKALNSSFDNQEINVVFTYVKTPRLSSFYKFYTYPSLNGFKLLPKAIKLKDNPIKKQESPKFSTYTIIDVPADGNCAFTSVKIAMNDDEFKDKIGKKLTREQTDAIKTLREATADKMKKVIIDSEDFIEMLQQPGFWNNGIDGAVGIKVLSFVAEALEEPILVLTQEPNGQYRYWISGTKENPHDGNLIFNNITIENFTQMSIEEKIEEILNAHPNVIKLFHNGIHFQAIVKKLGNA